MALTEMIQDKGKPESWALDTMLLAWPSLSRSPSGVHTNTWPLPTFIRDDNISVSIQWKETTL